MGMPVTAHLNVIQKERAETSSSVTLGWKRIPPFAGPRALLCWTRKAWKIRMLPSSRRTGRFACTVRRGSFTMAAWFGDSPSTPAASSNWRLAFSKAVIGGSV